MKTILFSTMLAVCLIGCQKKEDGGSSQTPTPAPTTSVQTPAEVPPAPGGPIVIAPAVLAECILSQGYEDEEPIAIERQRLDISAGNGLAVKGWDQIYPMFSSLRAMGSLQAQWTTLIGMRTSSDSWGLRQALYWLTIRDQAVFSMRWSYDINCQVIR
jgi:hypothetical protein